jgi:transcriptional regulator with XRE-family HTH domain
MTKKLKDEIRRLRLKAGFKLREFARRVGISAAYLSDIEHGRRMPSDEVLHRMAESLEHVGATYQQLKSLDARIEAELAKWVEAHPEARQMLREVRSSKRPPKEVLEKLRKILKDEDQGEQ